MWSKNLKDLLPLKTLLKFVQEINHIYKVVEFKKNFQRRSNFSQLKKKINKKNFNFHITLKTSFYVVVYYHTKGEISFIVEKVIIKQEIAVLWIHKGKNREKYEVGLSSFFSLNRYFESQNSLFLHFYNFYNFFFFFFCSSLLYFSPTNHPIIRYFLTELPLSFSTARNVTRIKNKTKEPFLPKKKFGSTKRGWENTTNFFQVLFSSFSIP